MNQAQGSMEYLLVLGAAIMVSAIAITIIANFGITGSNQTHSGGISFFNTVDIVQGGSAVCGDGVCSSGENNSNCAIDCFCGNGTCDSGENNASCPSDCPLTQFCGNNIQEPPEDCDGSDIPSDCASQGFFTGNLSCFAQGSANECSFDSSDCNNCGNGTNDPEELCEGSDVGGITCLDIGFGGGTLACNSDCQTYNVSGCSGTNEPPLTPMMFQPFFEFGDPTATPGNAQVTLEWASECYGEVSEELCPTYDIDHYNIYYKANTVISNLVSGYDNVVQATVIQSPPIRNSFTVTGLTNGTLYYFWITAVDTATQEGTANFLPSPAAQKSATPSDVICGDGICSIGENCPADNIACAGAKYRCLVGTYTCSGGSLGTDGCLGDTWLNNAVDPDGFCGLKANSPDNPGNGNYHCCWDDSGGSSSSCLLANISCPFGSGPGSGGA